jgi:hypothetical protein
MVVRDKPAAKTCRNLEADLVLYYYRELAERDRRDCEAHLKECEYCRSSLAEMHRLLPLTAVSDEPPPAFWDGYSRELRQKLDSVAGKGSWWKSVAAWFKPLPVPALATGAVLLMALALTLGKEFWQASAPAPDDQAVIEVLPMAEQLEFFSDMDLLDNLDLLETLTGQGNGTV